jgi:D-serine deaminase-like pyridoxal phosphate-dependent protein
MTARAEALGVALRPHLKTAKSVAVAGLATAAGAKGITVSTLAEAAYFAGHGFRDILYAVGCAPAKLDDVAALDRRAGMTLLIDSVVAAEAVAAHPHAYRVLIEIDTGDHRCGIAPDSPELLAVARAVEASGRSRVAGVLTHAGHSYDARDAESMARIAEAERAGAVRAAEILRAAGFESPVVSVGSTPTATFARNLSGATEMRPGVYMFGDLFQAGIGTCRVEDIALSVLATVIGHRPAENAVVIDAGALALSKDRSTEAIAGGDLGYGVVCDLDGRPLPGVIVSRVSQEHGRVTSRDPLPFASLPIGARVRVLPNHACITAAAHDVYHVVAGGLSVESVWDRCRGW